MLVLKCISVFGKLETCYLCQSSDKEHVKNDTKMHVTIVWDNCCWDKIGIEQFKNIIFCHQAYVSLKLQPEPDCKQASLLCKHSVEMTSGEMIPPCGCVCAISETSLSSWFQERAGGLWSALWDRETISCFWRWSCYWLALEGVRGERDCF